MSKNHDEEDRSNTTFWNRLIPLNWNATLWCQQYLQGKGWWTVVHKDDILAIKAKETKALGFELITAESEKTRKFVISSRLPCERGKSLALRVLLDS
jgi:hypothetical protein